VLLTDFISFIFCPFPNQGPTLYSKFDVLAFVIASMAVALCSMKNEGTQWHSQEFWTGTRDAKGIERGWMRGSVPFHSSGVWGLKQSPKGVGNFSQY